MIAWLAMAVAAIMQSPIGMFRYLLLRRLACLAIGAFRLWIFNPFGLGLHSRFLPLLSLFVRRLFEPVR